MRLNETAKVYLPEFRICDETKKERLITICKNDFELNKYLPDKDILDELSRDFLLMVSILIC